MKEVQIVNGVKFETVFLAKGLHTASILEGLDCSAFATLILVVGVGTA